MIKLYFSALVVLLAIACGGPQQIGIQVNGEFEGVKCLLVTNDSTYPVVLDPAGAALVTMAEKNSPGYGLFRYGKKKIPLYLNGKSLNITLTEEDKELKTQFSGDGAKINTYLNSPDLKGWEPNYRLEEKEFLDALDAKEKALYNSLDSSGLETSFTSKEKQRIRYQLALYVPGYPSSYNYHTCIYGTIYSDAYYDRLKTLLVEDESLLELDEYKNTLYGTIIVLCTKEREEHGSYPALFVLQSHLNFIDQNLKNPAVVSYLVDKFIAGYIQRNGTGDLQELAPIYNAKVTDQKAKARFNTLQKNWAAIAPGQPSPDFSYPDVDGKKYSLKDFAGKYVYIDMWATWCGPCRAQFPALYKLEHRYADKDIHFISISSDDNEEAWEELVRTDKMPGIQLNINGNRDFMDTYLITAIPRFILLDKEGKIMNPDMTRPSDPKTTETLDNLLLK